MVHLLLGHVSMIRAIFLDRDGVLNRPFIRDGKSFPPMRLADFQLLEGVDVACKLLKQAGFLLVVVTNQPDVATGKQTLSVVQAMHLKLRSLLPVDDIFVCYHTDQHNCACRKPRPGMLLDAAQRHQVSLSHSFMIGDRWRDVQAGQSAGCSCFFIDYHYREKRPDGRFQSVSSLLEAAHLVLSHTIA